MKVKDFIKHLQLHYDPKQEIAAPIWSRDDIDNILYKRGIEPSDMSAKDKDNILATAYEKHDAEVGINWQVLEYYVDEWEHRQRRKAGKK